MTFTQGLSQWKLSCALPESYLQPPSSLVGWHAVFLVGMVLRAWIVPPSQPSIVSMVPWPVFRIPPLNLHPHAHGHAHRQRPVMGAIGSWSSFQGERQAGHLLPKGRGSHKEEEETVTLLPS